MKILLKTILFLFVLIPVQHSAFYAENEMPPESSAVISKIEPKISVNITET
jgi:hypothetical protein